MDIAVGKIPASETLLAAGFEALLGTMTDWELSQQAGLHVVQVYNEREELGIPAFGRPLEQEVSRSQRTYWTPEMDLALGKAPDWWVAHKLGLTQEAVRSRRLWLGAPSWMERNRVIPKGVKRWSKEAERIHNARRRHRKAGLPDTLTLGQWKYAIEFFEGRCAYCGRRGVLTEDHLVPLSKEGGRVALNILPACSLCNSEKHTTQACVWIRCRFSPERAQAIEAKIAEYLSLVKLKEQGY